MSYKILGALAMTALLSNTHAQVFRCLDESGKPIFTDKPCAANQSGRQILRQRSQEEIYEERIQAMEAENRKRARILAEEPTSADAPPRNPAYLPSSAPARRVSEWECKNARRSYKITLGAKHSFAKSHAEAVAKERRNVAKACGEEPFAPSLGVASPARSTPPPPQSTPPPPEHPGLIVNCDPGGCWDTNGRRLNNAAGENFHRSDGKFCRREGPNVVCN